MLRLAVSDGIGLPGERWRDGRGARSRQDCLRKHAASNSAAVRQVGVLRWPVAVGKTLRTVKGADDVTEPVELSGTSARANGESPQQRLDDKAIGSGERSP
jgi:hypothetical protein